MRRGPQRLATLSDASSRAALQNGGAKVVYRTAAGESVAAITECTKPRVYCTAFRDVIGSLYVCGKNFLLAIGILNMRAATALCAAYGSVRFRRSFKISSMMKRRSVSTGNCSLRSFNAARVSASTLEGFR